MIEAILRYSVGRPWVVVAATAALVLAGLGAARGLAVDAIPDLSDTQVIVQAEWMGRGADVVADQLAVPLMAALVGADGVRTVRSFSMPGMAFLYLIYEHGADLERARAAAQQALASLTTPLPAGAKVSVGPPATGVGWVLQYALVDDGGRHDLSALRQWQDDELRPALLAIEGVAEVATLGGAQPLLQVAARPRELARLGLPLAELAAAARRASALEGGGMVELAEREAAVRVDAQAVDVAALRAAPVRTLPGGRVLRIGDVADVSLVPAVRRGVTDLDGRGEVIGGIVVARSGADVRAVLGRVHDRLATVRATAPAGVELRVTYDRSTLIDNAIATLRRALAEELLTVALVLALFLLHLRSALVPVLVLPAALALAAGPLRLSGMSLNILSLGGVALAIGDLVDATVVLVDDAHKRLEQLPAGAAETARREAILRACLGVGPAVFGSLLLLVVSFLPVFALQGQALQLFAPLAATKTFAMAAAALLSITLAPALLVLLVRGKIRREQEHPISRALVALYRPFARLALWNPKTTLLIASCAAISALPLWLGLGSEFMPTLDEGDLLAMPTTLAGISPAEAQRSLQLQDRIIRTFPEVRSVHGKAGRAETSTDPAPLSMVETVIQLQPRERWRHKPQARWWHGPGAGPPPWLPAWAASALERWWPSSRPMTLAELTAELQAAVDLPGWTNAWTMPIKTRIDMLSTGIRTAVGVKVYAADQATIDAAAERVVAALQQVSGARSVFYERSEGAAAIDIAPRPAALARAGLQVGELQELLALGLAGAAVGEVVQGRARWPVQVRLAADARGTAEALQALPLAVGRAAAWPATSDAAPSTSGPAAAIPSNGADMNAMAGMGGGPSAPQAAAAGGSDAGVANAWSALVGTTAPVLPRPVVRLGDVAEVTMRPTPAMVRHEDGSLVGAVYVDLDPDTTDAGAWVQAARHKLSAEGVDRQARLEWTGQYLQWEATRRQMAWVIPLTLALIVALLWWQFRDGARAAMVLCSVPFSLVGAVWLLHLLDYRLSTAVYVGMIALTGVAAETGIVMLLYLEERVQAWEQAGRLRDRAALREAVLEGAVLRLRPKLMTVGMNVLGLAPLLWAEGTGAEVMRRIVAPMVGGLLSSTFLTLEVLPVLYVAWRGRRLPRQADRAAAASGGP